MATDDDDERKWLARGGNEQRPWRRDTGVAAETCKQDEARVQHERVWSIGAIDCGLKAQLRELLSVCGRRHASLGMIGEVGNASSP